MAHKAVDSAVSYRTACVACRTNQAIKSGFCLSFLGNGAQRNDRGNPLIPDCNY